MNCCDHPSRPEVKEADVRAALDERVARKQAGDELAVAPLSEEFHRDLNSFSRRYTLAASEEKQPPRRCL